MFEGHRNPAPVAACNPDGKHALTASFDWTAKEWDLETGECLKTLDGHGGNVNSVAYSPDGSHAFTASSDETAKEWNLSTRECLKTFDEGDVVKSATYRSDGKRALITHMFGVRERDLETGECMKTLDIYGDVVNSAVCSPGGTYALIAYISGIAVEWDVGTETRILS